MITKKKMIQIFSEVQDQTIHYLSNFAEMIHSHEYAAEKAGIDKIQGWIIKDVEIFAAGTWRGIDYTEQDLENMVKHFYDLKKDGRLDPVLKVDHSESARDQIGWILDIKQDGGVILADVHVTEWEAYDKISSGTWKKVSAEIYLPELAEEEFGIKDHILRAVAVVSIPKVKSIKGIVLNSERWDDPGAAATDPGEKQKTKGGDPKVDKLLQLLSELGFELTDEQKAKLEGKKEDLVSMFSEGKAPEQKEQHVMITADQFVALSEQFSTLEKGNKDLVSKVAELTKGSKKAELDKWFTSLSESGKVVPAEKEEIMAFAEKLEGEALEAYKKTFEKRAKVVNLGESDGQQAQNQEDGSFAAFNEQFGQKKYN